MFKMTYVKRRKIQGIISALLIVVFILSVCPMGFVNAEGNDQMASATDAADSENSYSENNDYEETYQVAGDAEEKHNQWMEDASGWWYLKTDGSYSVGWENINNRWYYFDNNGYMVTGWQEIGGDWYFFWDVGEMFTGWYNSGGTWYYMDETGAMQTGWTKIDDYWYYLNSDGAMQTGWQSISGYWYYLYEDGSMATGVIKLGEKYYDMGTDGGMVDQTAIKAQGYSSSTNYLIMIDRSSYRLYVFKGSKGNWSMLKNYPMSDGASTPNGEFTMGIKLTSFGEEKGYSCWYASQIQGNYLIHSVGYAVGSQNPSDIIDGRMGVTISHGCIRLEIENAKWIYNNVPSGTKIVIYK
ncbi:MAG: L,D-transpeptidase family protein [Eubacterium sp.]|nr:L,D-transpeptidase family protein [Eubacterium sp.]